MQIKAIKTCVVLVLPLLLLGCKTLASESSTGVIVARRAQIRSSTAVVAADLLQVNRGDTIEILESTDVADPSDNTRKERWLRVKARDEDATEGWIEARNVMPEDVLDESRKIAEQDKDIPAQASGQLRASSNLRLTPDRSDNENIMMRLDSGSSFEIVGWKRVPKPKSSESIESDVAPKAGSAQQGSARSARQAEEPAEEEQANELWYRVRLPPNASPAPAGWIYGKQVELSVPSDIIFYRGGREFVAWQRLDGDTKDNNAADKDSARDGKPGSWMILEKSLSNRQQGVDEPDFDRIYVLGYDKRNQEHYTAYRSPDLRGYLPARIEGNGDNKSFTVRLQEQEGGEVKEVRFTVYKDARGVLKITAPNLGTGGRRRR
ncbi:MAG TPA: hypothetical protein VM941_07235 [Pyrinomonadaceae bacterium]|jgi:hypothetical protein|nr:hypothetical protein [Pyrinomonadaceae bacterium]